ncbi:MAG: hypothetical protein M0D55_08135 [Elusimicrobiota bacterium]|nr:MAG: hypothetical protein M0D55_08135 [Elusimicrobiota bacterium]
MRRQPPRGGVHLRPPRLGLLRARHGLLPPLVRLPSRDWGEGSAKHSCWNRFWEVPAALVAVPLAIGIIASPILIPLLLL